MNSTNATAGAKRTLPVTALIALCLLVASSWWTFRWMMLRWDAPGGYFSHGWLILPISAFLVFRNRERIASCPRRPCLWGFLVLAPSILAHLLASAWHIGVLSGLALVGLVAGTVLTFFGAEMLRLNLFPILFLLFMVPLPEYVVEKVSFVMKLAAAQAASRVTDLLGVIAVREGSRVQLSNGTLIVDDVCSGLKYLIALTAFGALYACISSVARWGKGVLFLISVPVSFLANIARIIVMILVANWWGVDQAEKWYFHDLFGFFLFATAFLLLFLAESLMLADFGIRKRGQGGAETRRHGDAETSRHSDPARAGEESHTDGLHRAESARFFTPLRRSALSLRPKDSVQNDRADSPLVTNASPVSPPPGGAAPVRRGTQAIALALLSLTAGLSIWLSRPREIAAPGKLPAAVPLSVGAWRGADYALPERVYEILGTRDVLSRSYSDDGRRSVQLVIVSAQHTRGRTHPPEQCLSGEGSKIQSSDEQLLKLPLAGKTKDLPFRELMLEGVNGERGVIWYFYKSKDSVTDNYWRHQLNVVLGRMSDVNCGDVLVRAESSGEDDAAGRQNLKDFLSVMLPKVYSALP